MVDLKEAFQSAEEDIQAASEWVDKLYNNNFAEHFTEAKNLFERLKSKEHPITDDELSWILITLPIKLFEVAETLNRFKLNEEIVKLRYKKSEADIVKSSKGKTITERKDEAAVTLVDDKLLIMAYSIIISRVESEISLSKELIMGAKKIWDSRRKADSVMPVSEADTSDGVLPDYNRKSYIHGSEMI